MACFVVPAAEAVVTTVVHKLVTAKEKKKELLLSSMEIYPQRFPSPTN